MNILSGLSDFFGLDLGSTALRAVQLRGSGPIKVLEAYHESPVGGNITLSDSKTDQQRLKQIIKDFLHQSGISSRSVVVNLPSQRVFTTVIDYDRLPPEELAQSMRYQAESFIPTPIDKSKVDWAIIGDSPKDPSKVEVLLSSVPIEFVESRLDLLESIGLNVIAFEPDSLALARAVVAYDATVPQMVLDIGDRATDLVIAMNGAPHLTRAIPTGAEAIVHSAAQNLAVETNQAEQFVYKFGLGKDKLEGKVYDAIIGTVDALSKEIEQSIKFFQERYTNTKLDRIIVTGRASSLPEFPLYIANRFGLNVEIGNSWRNVSVPVDRQDELLAQSNHFAVAAGLAERME